MTFSSMEFLFMFVPFLLLAYLIVPKKMKNGLLLFASLLFYAWGNLYHVFLLIILIIINFWLGKYIACADGKKRLQHLVEAIVLNVSILLYFKYYGFVLESIFSMIPNPPAYSLFSIPLGISFFVFSILSYQIDVYRKTVKAESNLLYFALFVSFFPKLIMGPIERYAFMRKQFEFHPMKAELVEKGCIRFMSGLAQKLILANTMGSLWAFCNEASSLSLFSAWLGIFAFTLQIYFDFQGYMNMAIGLGNIFGFQLSENFHYPYLARSVSDFWRRWHITLSAWLKDYIYIPLGGNRTTFNKVLRNLMIVWVITGIWHGANWTFLVWGIYYGVILIIEKFIICDQLAKIPTILRIFMTLFVVMIGWVFFASASLSEAFGYLGNMFLLRGNQFGDMTSLFIIKNYVFFFVIGIVSCTPLIKNIGKWFERTFSKQMWFLKPIFAICFFVLLLSCMVSNTFQAFLYFKF